MEVPPSTEKKVKRPFYVRKPQILEPRREFCVNGRSTLPKKSDTPQVSSCSANGAVRKEHRYKYLWAKGIRKRKKGTQKDTHQDIERELSVHESSRRSKMKGETQKEIGIDNDQAVEGGMSDQEFCRRRRYSSSTQKAFEFHSLSCDTSDSICPIDI